MTARIISGKALAFQIKVDLKTNVDNLKAAGITPNLAVILVGDNPASQQYVRNKMRVAAEWGIATQDYLLSEKRSEPELLKLVHSLNCDNRVHGILVQLPLPKHINSSTIIEAISPEKDIDGLHPLNLGFLLAGRPKMIPCTPAGILEILHREHLEIAGKDAVVIGRSILVGKPVAQLLTREHATVTLCHSRTLNLRDICKRADIFVVAVGKARMIDAGYIKPGATVIDVGINFLDKQFVGDVDFESVQRVTGAITPVPGGVGPLTIAMLMKNTIRAAER
jgi:methylenetetrahydrofolate dehydrogenase (NADP+)/methenyltetrahydrofolate cyclohydrolase